MKRHYFLMLCMLIVSMQPMAIRAAGESIQPWDDRGWKACIEKYKRVYKKDKNINIYRYIGGKCGPDADAKLQSLHDGECFMKIAGPAAILNASGFEIMLVCMQGRNEEKVCTNKSSQYSEAFKTKIRNDSRCKGFPNLVSDPLGAKPTAVWSKKLLRSPQGQNHQCQKAVAKVRRLENNSRFDYDRHIRREWQDAVEFAMKLECDF